MRRIAAPLDHDRVRAAGFDSLACALHLMWVRQPDRTTGLKMGAAWRQGAGSLDKTDDGIALAGRRNAYRASAQVPDSPRLCRSNIGAEVAEAWP
jgi:hypothetical protein